MTLEKISASDSSAAEQDIPEEIESEDYPDKEREDELEFGYGEGFSDVEYAAEYLYGESKDITGGSQQKTESKEQEQKREISVI